MSKRDRKSKSDTKGSSWISTLPLPDGAITSDAQRTTDTRIAIGLVALYAITSVVYGVLADAPWDDDCVVRYFNTLRATSEPKFFFDLWSRPLFVLLFVFTAKLGTTAMMVQMVAISSVAGWFLFRAVQRIGFRYSWLVLVFFFFQTYYFSTSRNNLTEPLAAAAICFGLYALVRERYVLFALLGALLPLARLEISVALGVWALVLLMAGRWRLIPVLGAGLALMMIGGWLVREDSSPMWLLNETLNKEDTANRYGHQEFLHYFKRIAYVTGPVVFYFLFVGLGTRLGRLRMDLFVLLQAVVIFMLYVVFSWKLNMGNAAGFLRNLVPLAPLIAVLALVGVNAWIKAMAPDPDAEAVPVLSDRERRKGKVEARKPVGPKPWLVHALSLLAVLVVFLYFSTVLKGHHKLTTEPTLTNLYIVVGLGLLLILGALLLRRKPTWRSAYVGTAMTCIAGATFGFTTITEPPDAHLSAERVAMGHFTGLYPGSYLEELPLYINHNWFFWRQGLVNSDPRFQRVTMKNVEEAPTHAIILWENHYSRRLAGDVQRAWISARKDLVELYHATSSDNAFEVILYQKVDTVKNDRAELGARFIEAFPNELGGYYGRSMARSMRGDMAGTLEDAASMLRLDSTNADALRMHAWALFNRNDNAGAIAGFEKLVKRYPTMAQAHYYIGAAYNRTQQPKLALPALENAVKEKALRETPEVMEQLGTTYFNLEEYQKAYNSFDAVVKLRPNAAQSYVNRAAALLRLKKPQESLRDAETALKLDPGSATAHYAKASAYERMDNAAGMCASLRAAAELGYAPAITAYTTSCQ